MEALIECHYEEGAQKVNMEILVNHITNLRVMIIAHMVFRMGRTFTPHHTFAG
jgi:hypothetical protein